MELKHIVGEDFRGRMVPIYLFECEKSEKDWPKVAGFQFGIHGGIIDPAHRWTTTEWEVAKKLIQYADEEAIAALKADGVLDVDQARRNAIKREKSLASKEQNELASMSETERLHEVQRWLGYAEKDAQEQGCECELYQQPEKAPRLLRSLGGGPV